MRKLTRRHIIAAAVVVAVLGAAGANVPQFIRRWTPPPARASLRLVLNVPAYRLEVYRGNERIHSYEVAVGRPGHRTPAGHYEISHIVWNPWWHPPDSGWAQGKKPVPPGPDNPMGRVKMYFAPLYYIHGTPEVASLGRAASHGCVRMSNTHAIALARLVEEYGKPGTKDEVDRLVAHPNMTKTIWLDHPVPLTVEYAVAEVRDGRLEVHPDVYDAGTVKARIYAALAASGHDRGDIDEARVDALVASPRPRQGTTSVPVRSLLVQHTASAGAPSR